MKRALIHGLFLLAFIPIYTPTNAGHLIGGEIGWQCLSNGKFVFHMSLYRECSGIPWSFRNDTLRIHGSTLPNGRTSIVLKPDSVAFLADNSGDQSPKCTSQYGSPDTCPNGDDGSIQKFPYKSDPITIGGIPPASGWHFYYDAPCCRPSGMANLNSTGALLLRAIMFPTVGNDSTDICYDSSPMFTEIPPFNTCRGEKITYNHIVRDIDFDSIGLSWGNPINGPISAPVPLTYRASFSHNNPTPNTSYNLSNIASSLNSETGDITFAVYNRTGRVRYYLVQKAQSWRDGKMIAEVSREFPMLIRDCPRLPNAAYNQSPNFHIPLSLDTNEVYRDTVNAGDFIDHLITVNDLDSTGVGNSMQIVNLKAFGLSFSEDFSDSALCPNGDSTCAILSPAPTLIGGEFISSDTAMIRTHFRWQTNCSHLAEDSTEKTHYFTFKYFDDHCPIPSFSYRTLAITVQPPNQNCASLTSVGDKKWSIEKNIRTFPNPTKGWVNIGLVELQSNLIIQVYNVHGQLVQEEYYTAAQTIQVELKQPPGIYFIQLLNSAGETAQMKVVKQ